MDLVLEIVRMIVAADREERFLRDRPAAIEAIRDAFPGFRSARLFRGEEAEVWYDVVFWDALEHAQRAAAEAASLPAAAAWFAHIQETTLMEHGILAHALTPGDA